MVRYVSVSSTRWKLGHVLFGDGIKTNLSKQQCFLWVFIHTIFIRDSQATTCGFYVHSFYRIWNKMTQYFRVACGITIIITSSPLPYHTLPKKTYKIFCQKLHLPATPAGLHLYIIMDRHNFKKGVRINWKPWKIQTAKFIPGLYSPKIAIGYFIPFSQANSNSLKPQSTQKIITLLSFMSRSFVEWTHASFAHHDNNASPRRDTCRHTPNKGWPV